MLFAVVESERAKEFEPWSAVRAFGRAEELKGFVTGVAERKAVLVEIESVIKLGSAGVNRNGNASEAALVKQEVVDMSAVESGVGDESIAVEVGIAVKEIGNNGH